MPRSRNDAPPFSLDTIAFLRALKRNNRRDWFLPRRERYEQHVKGPMLVLIERLAGDFQRIAPEIVASPKHSMYRIYRDTRFSEDKRPYKTQVAASFRWRGVERGRGAGLYLEVGPAWTWMGGGFYAPDPRDLVRIREHIAGTHPALERIVRSAAFRKRFGALEGDRLTRVPRGYASGHPAAEYLKYRNFLAGRECSPEFAASRDFYPALLDTFAAVMPLVRFLNAPLVAPSPGGVRISG
jgi:uncharacterized protein (TIGR02453 family)